MSFTIPDVAAAWNPIQARIQTGDIQILTDGINGVGVASGCAVTAQASPNMTVAVASGTARIGGSNVSVTSGNVTITANATGQPRLDLICVNASGTKSAQAGTAAASPKYPTIPASSAVLAAVLVPTGASTITANNIVDKRALVASTTGLVAANNLSDVSSAATSRTNLGAAATSHVHAATDVTSATVATARLGSGSASSSTFLRGDQTWATPAGAGTNFGSRYTIVVPTGVAATDTAAIQAAMDAVGPTDENATAGTVYLSAGDFVINAGLVRPHRVAVFGAGVGATRIYPNSSFPAATPVFRNENENTAARAEMGFYTNFQIDGANLLNDGVDGIVENHSWTTGDAGEEFVDRRSWIVNVFCHNLTGTGFTQIGRNVSYISRCQAFNCKGAGFVSGLDAFLTECDAGSCGTYGFHVTGNTQLVNCKSWFSGYFDGSMVANLASGEGVGFFYDGVYAGTIGSTLIAQDNARNGIRLLSSGRITLTNIEIDSNNNSGSVTDYAGIEMYDSYWTSLHDTLSWDRAANSTKMKSAFAILGGSTLNDFNGRVLLGADLIRVFTTGSALIGNGYHFAAEGTYMFSTVGATTYTPNMLEGDIQEVDLTGNATIGAATFAYPGARLTFVFLQSSGTTNTVTFNSVYKRAGGSFTASTGASAKSSISFVYDGTNWLETGRALALA